MKHRQHAVRKKANTIPQRRFEDQRLTSFAGFDRSTLFLQLVIHVLLRDRELRDATYDQDGPLVQRRLGLKRLPDVATISRMLKEPNSSSWTVCSNSANSCQRSSLKSVRTARS